jgi:hypothetical protein
MNQNVKKKWMAWLWPVVLILSLALMMLGFGF